MDIQVTKTGLQQIAGLRTLFLQEYPVQFVHNKCHLYGWADEYLFTADGQPAGYASVWGSNKREDRDAIFEFYLLVPYRKMANTFFTALRQTSGTPFIECQTNHPQLQALVFEHARNIQADAILFEDQYQTSLSVAGAHFAKKNEEDDGNSDDRSYVIRQEHAIVATGGLMLNYNLPFADIYYEVHEQHRNKGIGSWMVQELKKAAYAMGRVPSARCNVKNTLSKATLLKAGMRVGGYLLQGELV
jgi:GNAT superfamily N-acetyltransferase